MATATRQHLSVSIEGPHSSLNRDGDEVPYWTVCLVNDYGDPVGKVYEVYSRVRAQGLGQRMATDRRLDLIDDSAPQ